MAISLQDQLLKAGLTDKKKLGKVSKEQRKQKKQQRRSKEAVVDETRVQAQRALAEKTQRSRGLAQQQNIKAERKAIVAQIRQLIEVNRLSREEAELPYNFSDGKHIKKMFVTAKMQNYLASGNLAIVKLGDAYELVPAIVAEKIAQRDPGRIIVRNEPTTDQQDEDDPYADYQVPDDLMW